MTLCRRRRRLTRRLLGAPRAKGHSGRELRRHRGRRRGEGGERHLRCHQHRHHDFGYTYDPNGNLTAITDTSPGTAIGNYAVSYDGINEVTKVLEQASGITQHTTTYGYDPARNLTSRGHDTATPPTPTTRGTCWPPRPTPPPPATPPRRCPRSATTRRACSPTR